MSTTTLDQKLRKVQHWTGISIFVFTTLHIANASTGAISQDLYDKVLGVMRNVYRPHPLVERCLLLTPIIVHAGASILRNILSRMNKKEKTTAISLHKVTGFALLAILPVHYLATRVVSGRNADFTLVSSSLEKFPGFSIMFPYYVALLFSGIYHSFTGLNTILSYRFNRSTLNKVIGTIFGIGTIALLGFSGYLYNIDRTNYPLWENIGKF
ncbi:hypothetical protein ABK040_003111 [Willaertia magna]